MTQSQPWWQKTAIYQIYPRSFMDASADGIGDLRGIISRLDYVKDLGFDCIWVSPIFRSPQKDFGYDVSDYFSVSPEYGNMSDADDLIAAAHSRGMRILFDLVLNHTSREHPWFKESCRSRTNPKRDWYIWQDGRGTRPPNNWKSLVGGSAWHYDGNTDQWYFASFLPFQPDLNFRNPEVSKAMFDVVRFWLDKGVDGFRLDIFHCIFKDERFRNNPFDFRYVPTKNLTAGFFQKWKYNLNRPENFELARDLRSLIDTYSPQRLLLGEVFGSDHAIKNYLGDRRDGLNLVFLWNLLPIKAEAGFLRDVIRHYEARYPEPFKPVYVLGNHDQKRFISKIGNDVSKAKLLALVQLTARGVPVTYYGEEIGMPDGDFSARIARDPLGKRYRWIPDFLVKRLGLYVNRDGCRTPMQWDNSPNGGFCPDSVIPWLPVDENTVSVNVAAQKPDENSLLNVYRRLLHLRQKTPAILEGTLELFDHSDVGDDLLAYRRNHVDETVLILINWGKNTVQFHHQTGCNHILLAIGMKRPVKLDPIAIPPDAGIILTRSN
jgi:oligo-1,6-glucosidase/alpha-glucosidase